MGVTQFCPVEPLPEVMAFVGRQHGLWIDGKSMPATSGETLAVYDPATGNVLTHVAAGGAQDIDSAVKAARRAFEGEWSHLRPTDRERMLIRLSELMEVHAEELAQIETLNQGKSIVYSRAIDVGHSIECMRYMAGWATKLTGETIDVSIPTPGVSYRAYSMRRPVGVVGAIVAWNFPLLLAVWKLAPALAAGCTVVLKPSEETPLTALRLAELCAEAGIPPGVLNVVTGLGAQAGAALSQHPELNKLAFTGSTEVGKLIGHAAVNSMAHFSLELGGKSPFIVLDDMDPAQAAQGAANAIFFNAGQVCVAGSRLYAHKKVFDRVVGDLTTIGSRLRLGAGLDPQSEMTPLVSKRHKERVCGYIELGREQGATFALGGDAPAEGGYFVPPTIMVDTNHSMRVVQEEIFGPVLVAMPYDDLDELVKKANDTAYGLAASIWSNDLTRVMRLIPRIHAGAIWVNTHGVIDANMSFGGMKQSGIGREMGRAGVEMYTDTQSVCIAY